MNDKCPICEAKTLGFLQRDQVPVHQNLVFVEHIAAQKAVRGDLLMQVCESCGFVHNRAFDPSLLSYGDHYNNCQSCSPFFDQYLDGLVEYLVEKQGVRNCQIVEIGCGKNADFLKKLLNYPSANNKGVGFDPSYTGNGSELEGRLIVYPRYYDDSCSDVIADVVICRHVIEHVADPLVLLRSVRVALKNNPNAKIFFETPCVDWILKNKVVWDFFYEHCSLFNSHSLCLAFELAGFSVVKIDHVFGGQYLWLEARLTEEKKLNSSNHHASSELAQQYGAAIHERTTQWKNKLLSLATQGPVALWGAGAKGATLASLIDADGEIIDCIVDLNPGKQGCYLPGSAHLIVSPHELKARKVKAAILMNPNYRAENIALLAELNIEIALIDLEEI
uniref:class I SAM-dependent methyltransferase n=1 Tax=Iodobacter sp. CM08 TaxID=3085902 RepID=UPI002981EB98|nr:class I SAM-dependent methyltransferase [Iodobacter sp. CM08]